MRRLSTINSQLNVSNLNIALLPLRITWGDKSANLDAVAQAMQQLHPATDLLVLPETFSTGFPAGMDKETVRPLAERNTGSTIERVKELARQHSVGIAGSFIADSGGSLYNRAFFIEPGGEETFADKRHLFTMAGEQKVFSPGFDRLSIRFRGWNLAMVICYDIRFPAWCRNVLNQYDALIAVANWPQVRVDAWNKLLVARAIENEAYVLGVDCRGTDTGGFVYDGSSAVIDYKGRTVADKSSDDSPFIYASLDMDALLRFRAKFPAWQDADNFRLL